MKCSLMHKRVMVADIELDDASGFIKRINTVYAPEHLPIGVMIKKGVADRAALNDWWTDRSIPASRSGIREALELLDNNTVAFAVVRFPLELRGYYEEQAFLRKLIFLPLSQGEYQIIISKDNPLQGRDRLLEADLDGLTEITHTDTFSSTAQIDISQNKLYTKDRMAQLQLLTGLPYAYLRSEPLPKYILDSHGLSQHPCSDTGAKYQNALIYHPQNTMSDIETAFLDYLKQESSSKNI